MRKSFFPGTTGIFALFFVPYIVTIIFNGANTTLINKKFNVEMLLPVIVSSQIEDKYEIETIKAQTIIARSNFYRTMKEEKNLAITLCQIKEEMEGKSLACVILQNKYEKAVTETEGKVIVWNKELKLVPYHELSAGQTRDGMEVFHNEDDSYLRSVHSLVDKNAKDYLNSVSQIIYVFLTIFLYLLKCPQSLILSALRAFCFCGKPHISRSIFLYFRYQAWLKSW